MESKFAILGNNINLGRVELRKRLNVVIKRSVGIISKIDIKYTSKDPV